MGTIVSLPAQRRRRFASDQTTNEATILLFMGVRYVRDEAPEQPAERPQPVAHRHCCEAALEIA